MRHKRRRNTGPVVLAALLAVFAHLLLLFTGLLPELWKLWQRLVPRPRPEQAAEVSLVKLTPAQWQQNLEIKTKEKQKRAEERLAKREPEKPKPPEKMKGQVVDVAPTPDDRPPEEARFLSEHNTRVEKESVSRHRRPDYGVAQPRPTVSERLEKTKRQQQSKSEKQLAILSRRKGKSETERQPSHGLELPTIPRRQSLKLKLDLDTGTLSRILASDPIQGNSDRLRLGSKNKRQEKSESGDMGQREKSLAMVTPPPAAASDMVNGAPANDHIEDVEEGEQTLLNSREFKYATFFNRIKRAVSRHWHPADVYLKHDPYGNIYGVKDRYTVVSVVLDKIGELKDVTVTRSCGVDFLDDEAVQAFQRAAPFPNPPKGLIEPDGFIRFQFGFYFEIGERPRIRAFRFQRYPF
ncbi:MAG: energy transducer TonB [Deltaproteobacteria bacterium]|nr:MAG: energy transducer TonB [Deltaproteobacteria bacterium]